MTALVMAGGEGKRFWPLSTKDKPKQFLSLVGKKSLLRQTVDRVLPLIPIEKVYIVTVEQYAQETLSHVPELPESNLILEPEGKNTAPCLAYGMLTIEKRHAESTAVVLPADHAILDGEAFRQVLVFAFEVAQMELLDSGWSPLITLGVTPTMPETGYGYIKKSNKKVASSDLFKAFKVGEFTEKPDFNTAAEFLKEGSYYWNSGIFIWKTSSILSAFSKLLPSWHGYFDGVSIAIGTSSEQKAVSQFYTDIDSGSIDKLILERSPNTVVIPISFPWSDLGNWKALDLFLRREDGKNIIRGESISIESSGCSVFGQACPQASSGKRIIALVGVENLVVVDTKDAVLILNKDSSQQVKKVVEELDKSCS